jgi:predicted RNase H-like nuclease (RuvC/YqgF family)
MSDKIITMACLYKESVKEANQLRKEIDIKDKRISLLTETLASRDKDIETLKAEITRQNNIIVQYMYTNASLRELVAEEKNRNYKNRIGGRRIMTDERIKQEIAQCKKAGMPNFMIEEHILDLMMEEEEENA